ncbi:TfoX/Sxy family protein [Proteus mirabilis]|nr:TfoX/Sxy family protein [Proteus mirabilis]MCW9719821.1 TfoX/Sxy family protein [Proteus mirabilis]MCZ4600803.1 TfoX/Sxy family protein [Proteus mirabilis]MDC5879398.1 TfoX/Sxy family protein [Proteus mirabilis]
MSILPEQRKAHLLSRVAEYGKLSKKSQFGGYSLMVDEVIFAITADNEFYLKGSLLKHSIKQTTWMHTSI